MACQRDFDNSVENKWCPGCGNHGILGALKHALAELGLEPQKTLLVSGIGQAAKTPHYLTCNFFHGLHGRALPVATGAKIANHDLTILVCSGDGDCYGEGGNHFINAIRRNLDITLLVHDNKVYGLTKGQASPTSDLRMVTRAQPSGVMLEPFAPLAVALALHCGFIARGYAGDTGQLSGLIQEGVRHRGFSLIDILQPCVSFNQVNTYQWYSSRVYDLQKEGHDTSDFTSAMSRAREWGDRIPTGILYRHEALSFTDKLDPLKKGTLAKSAYDSARLESLLAEF